MTSELLAVLWDMDGVLVDTGEFHFLAWQETLSGQGVDFSFEKFRKTFGMNNEGLLKVLLGDLYTFHLYQELSKRKENYFRQIIAGRVRMLPGVDPFLREIQADSILQAIGSSAPMENIEAIVEELGIRDYFKTMISAVGMPGKPDPAVYLAAASDLDILPEACLVIEDAVHGVEAARRAGMRCLATTTTNSASELWSAEKVVNSLEGISLNDLRDIFC
jgi:HAD superfamily hydrolase (TIGR01509 family)